MDKREAFNIIQDAILAEQVRTVNRTARNPKDAKRVMTLHNALWTIKQNLNLTMESENGIYETRRT